MQTLTRFYEDNLGFRYSDADSRPFDNSGQDYWQWRDYEMPSQPVGLIDFGIRNGFFVSKSDAKRKIQAGAVRVGLNDEKTPFRQCVKLLADRLLEPNDIIRTGKRMFGIIPPKPTLLQNLLFSIAM